MRNAAHAERAQTLPFWVFALTACLALTYYIGNYATEIKWQIEAQNAAESAAAGGVTADANIANQIEMQMYAEGVEEVRIRALNAALTDIVTVGPPTACATAATCNQDYLDLRAALNDTVAQYNPDGSGGGSGMKLTVADNLQTGGLQEAERNGVAVGEAADQVLSNDFTFTALPYGTTTSGVSNGIADIVACRLIATPASRLLGQPGLQFLAVGRAALGTAGFHTTVRPGDQPVPTPYQTPEPHVSTTDAGTYPDLTVNFSGMQVDGYFYSSGPVVPPAADAFDPIPDYQAGKYQCTQG